VTKGLNCFKPTARSKLSPAVCPLRRCVLMVICYCFVQRNAGEDPRCEGCEAEQRIVELRFPPTLHQTQLVVYWHA
jgi:hypothetical protein